jgi:hypothetical protein
LDRNPKLRCGLLYAVGDHFTAGLEKKEVDKLIKKLKDGGKLESPKRCYYQPK